MPEKGKISGLQLLLLLFFAEAGTAFYVFPAAVLHVAGPDSWLSVLLPATLFGLAVALVCVSLGQRYPSQVFTQYLPRVVGKIPGKILALAYCAFFIHISSAILGRGAGFTHVNLLLETPLLLIMIVFTVVAAYGAYQGIEVIARKNELVFGVLLLIMVIVLLLLVKEIKADHFRPFLENGLTPVLQGGLQAGVWRGEVFIILMLLPYLKKKEQAYKAALGMVLLSGLMATIIMVFIIGVYGDRFAAQLVYPVHSLARYISVGLIIERVEVLVVIVWIMGVIVKMALFLHTACIALATTMGVGNYHKMVLPLAIAVCFIASRFYSSSTQMDRFYEIWPYYGSIVELLIPGLVWLAAVVFNKRGDGNENRQKL